MKIVGIKIVKNIANDFSEKFGDGKYHLFLLNVYMLTNWKYGG